MIGCASLEIGQAGPGRDYRTTMAVRQCKALSNKKVAGKHSLGMSDGTRDSCGSVRERCTGRNRTR